MSFQKIKDVAIRLFYERGYEGASLADIAEEVGIKKSSIYNHYKNKDDLFLHILEKAFQEELLHVQKTLSQDVLQTEEQYINQFLNLAKNRLQNHIGARFIFRFTLFPPYHFGEEIGIKTSKFMDDLHKIIFDSLESSTLFSHLNKDELYEIASHYIIFLQGTYVEQTTHSFGLPTQKIEPAWNSYRKIFLQYVEQKLSK